MPECPECGEKLAEPKPDSRLRGLFLSAIIGAILGSIMLAHPFKSPGDPYGHSSGAGWGGIVGLFFGILFRAVREQRS